MFVGDPAGSEATCGVNCTVAGTPLNEMRRFVAVGDCAISAVTVPVESALEGPGAGGGTGVITPEGAAVGVGAPEGAGVG